MQSNTLYRFSMFASMAVLSAAVIAQDSRPAPQTRPTTPPRASPAEEGGKAGGMMSGGTTRVGELIGREIRNTRGDRLGVVNEIVIDDESGRIAYVVVGDGAASEAQSRLWVVPWDVLSSQRDSSGSGKTAYEMEIDRERIAGAPGFSRNEWPVMDRAYGRSAYAYYGRKPYWERRSQSAEGDERGLPRAGDSDGPPPRRPTSEDPNRTARDVPPLDRDDAGDLAQFPVGMFDAGSIKTFSATVTSVIEQTGSENDFGVGVRLLVKRDDTPNAKSDMLVYVGPTEFVKKQGASFNQNDRLTMTGAEMEREGRRVFVATSVSRGDQTFKLRRENGMPLWRRRVTPSGQ